MGKHSEIQRFPRLPDGSTLENAPVLLRANGSGRFNRTGKFLTRIVNGDPPRGYTNLSKKQKKVARFVASGMSIQEACKKAHVHEDSFFRWRRVHPLFRDYLNSKVMKNLEDVEGRLERHVIRASQVIDESLDMNDPYFRASVAKDVLKNRGRWKSSSTVEQKIGGNLNIASTVKVDDGGMDKSLLQSLVDGLIQIAGGKPVQKIIEQTEDGSPKALPPAGRDEGTASP